VPRNVPLQTGLRLIQVPVLKRIFGPKSEKVAGGWKKLHSGEAHDLYASPNYYYGDQIKEHEIGMTYSTHG
jgi:hypothetical protein